MKTMIGAIVGGAMTGGGTQLLVPGSSRTVIALMTAIGALNALVHLYQTRPA